MVLKWVDRSSLNIRSWFTRPHSMRKAPGESRELGGPIPGTLRERKQWQIDFFPLSRQQEENQQPVLWRAIPRATDQLRFLTFPPALAWAIWAEHHLGTWTDLNVAEFQNEPHTNTTFLSQGNSQGTMAVSKPNPGPWQETYSNDRKRAAPWSSLLRNERNPNHCCISWSNGRLFLSHCRLAFALNCTMSSS